MKGLIPFLVLLCLIISYTCQNTKTPPRQYFVEKDILVPVLVDIHLLYSLQSTRVFKEIATRYDSIDPYSPIFTRHGITKAAFDSTIGYYSENPRKMVDIYDEVIMQLTMLEDSLTKHHE